jgi:serine/threonine protein kinase
MGCIESTPEQAGLWDRYEFRANIGDGASSTVFMGAKLVRNRIIQFFQPDTQFSFSTIFCLKMLQNTVPEQLFAIKVMSKAHADAANWIFVFMQEVSMLKLLKHPNIVTFVESFETSNEYVLISEYLSGGQLFGRVGEFDVYNEQIASKLAKQMVQVTKLI